MMRTLTLLLIWEVAVAACIAASDAEKKDSKLVREQLQAFLDGKIPAKKLEITYSDLHGLYGGLKLTIRGSGEVEQKAVRQKAPDPRQLSDEEVRELVKFLIQEKAWEQVTPDAVALPDESRATLKITAGDAESSVWERTREMKSNKRLVRVLERIKKLAWPAEKSEK